jgi:two-component system KDP operon response regulator KdpE
VPKVLIADDDATLLEAISTLLGAAGFEVETATSAAELLTRWPRAHPAVVIVDLHMPGGGVDLVKRLSASSQLPVLVLSADNREEVMVAALDAGAEDYVTKPFSASELLARIRVVLRRGGSPEERTRIGPLDISGSSSSVSAGPRSVALTPTEMELLRAIAAGNGFVSTAELLAKVWGPAYHTEHEYVRAYVRRLRGKLDEIGQGDIIESRPGLGYRLRVD